MEQAKKMEKELKQKRADLKVARAKQNMIKKQAQIRKVERKIREENIKTTMIVNRMNIEEKNYNLVATTITSEEESYEEEIEELAHITNEDDINTSITNLKINPTH